MSDAGFLDPGLPAYARCDVKPLIDCAEYAAELDRALDTVGRDTDPAGNEGDYILISGWLLHLAEFKNYWGFTLDGQHGRVLLLDVLRNKARHGVKVCVLGWVSRTIQSNRGTRLAAGPLTQVNQITLETIREMRRDPDLASGIAMNVLAHPAGSVHTKLVVIGSPNHAIGFTGGIDLAPSRWGEVRHDNDFWHDVQVRVEGYGVKPLYELFQDMWYENFSRSVTVRYRGEEMPAVLPDAPQIEDFPLAPTDAGPHRVQSMTTLPRFNYKPGARWFVCPGLSFAPAGRFEVEQAIRHAVARAERYIYLEDQFFWSWDMMRWIRDAVNRNLGLKVLIMASGKSDPDDPSFPLAYVANAVNNGLLSGIMNPDKAKLIRMYRRMNPEGIGVTVHSKTMIIDDRWAYIGSNNVARRSLATDFEHAYSFTDDGTGLVKNYRKRLWADQLMIHNPDTLDDLDVALERWEDWSNPGGPSGRPGHIWPVPLPLPDSSPGRWSRYRYDTWDDPDSREPWGVG